jgi:hypothetical protein
MAGPVSPFLLVLRRQSIVNGAIGMFLSIGSKLYAGSSQLTEKGDNETMCNEKRQQRIGIYEPLGAVLRNVTLMPLPAFAG